MSTPQPPTRSQAPADPSRPWLQQTTTSSSSSSSSDATPNPQPQPPQTSRSHHPTLTDAVSTITPTSFATFHTAPCARSGLLTGIGAGSALGVLRWVMGLPIPRAANWAVGTGVLAAMGQYEYCQYGRRQEREKVKRVVEVYQAKQVREKEEEERRRREKEEQEREERERRGRGWWRFW